jgi:hypothetical protein
MNYKLRWTLTMIVIYALGFAMFIAGGLIVSHDRQVKIDYWKARALAAEAKLKPIPKKEKTISGRLGKDHWNLPDPSKYRGQLVVFQETRAN